MKRTLFTIALWAASAGATLLAPARAPAVGIRELTPPAAPRALTIAANPPTGTADTPEPWMLVLVGTTLLTFVAARRID
jgi:hypothetical protein